MYSSDISGPQHVTRIIKAGANGVIVGSAFVRIVEENQRNMRIAALKLRSLSKRMKKAARFSGTLN
jgi:tryptophan synthase alpha subunit